MPFEENEFERKMKALGLWAPEDQSNNLQATTPEEQIAAEQELGMKPSTLSSPAALPQPEMPSKITGTARSVGEITNAENQQFPEAKSISDVETDRLLAAEEEKLGLKSRPLPFDSDMLQRGITGQRALELENQGSEESSPFLSQTSYEAAGKKIRDLSNEDVNVNAGIPPYVRPEVNKETDRLLSEEEERLKAQEIPSPKEAIKDVVAKEFQSPTPLENDVINPLEQPELSDEGLQRAQEQMRQRQLITGLGEAAGRFAAVAPGGKFDRSFYEEQYKQAGQPVENIKERRESFIRNTQLSNYLIDSQIKKMDLKQKQELNKSDSPGTKALKAFFEYTHKNINFQKDIPGWNEMTGHDVEAFGKHLEAQEKVEATLARAKELQDIREENLKLRSEGLDIGRAREDRAERQKKDAALMKFNNDYNKNVKNLREATQYARNGLELINSKGPASKMIGAVSFMAARASGSNSQLSDKERAALAGRADLLTRFEQLVSTAAKSELIEKNKDAFRDLFTVYLKNANDFQDELATYYSNQLKENSSWVDEDVDEIKRKITGKPKSSQKTQETEKSIKSITTSEAQTEKTPPSQSLPKSVKQNGHIYILNEETGQYE